MPAIVPQVRTSNQHCRIIDIKWYQIELPLISGAHYILYKSIITRWSSCSNAVAFNLPCCCHIQRVRLRTADHRVQVKIGMCVCDCFCICVRMLLHHIASYWRYSSGRPWFYGRSFHLNSVQVRWWAQHKSAALLAAKCNARLVRIEREDVDVTICEGCQGHLSYPLVN